MKRFTAALAIGVLACGTSEVGAQDGAADGPTEGTSSDAPIDTGNNCPPKETQGGACTGTATCSYAQSTCTCSFGTWSCLDVRCPPKGQMPASCVDSFTCAYGFEDTCACRNGHWICCGGVAYCDPTVPTSGYPCCGAVQCGYACDGTLCAGPNSPMNCKPEATLCTCSNVWSCNAANSCSGDAGPG